MAAGSHLRSGLSSSALVDCGVDCSRSFCCGEATTLGCSRRGYEVSLQRNVRDDESERRLRILQLNPERVSRLDSYSLCASEWHAAMGSNSRADWINSSKWEASLCSGTLERGRKVQCSRVRAQDGSGGRQNQLSFHCIGLHRENLRGVHTRDDFMNPVTRKRTGGKKIGVTSSRISATLDPYETLGVPKSASEKEIKQAYRKMALKFHPDVNKQPDAQQKFLQIKAAYQTLVDAKSRAKYDSSNRATPKWDPFSWETESSSAQKPQEEEFYGFGKEFCVSIVCQSSPPSDACYRLCGFCFNIVYVADVLGRHVCLNVGVRNAESIGPIIFHLSLRMLLVALVRGAGQFFKDVQISIGRAADPGLFV